MTSKEWKTILIIGGIAVGAYLIFRKKEEPEEKPKEGLKDMFQRRMNEAIKKGIESGFKKAGVSQ